MLFKFFDKIKFFNLEFFFSSFNSVDNSLSASERKSIARVGERVSPFDHRTARGDVQSDERWNRSETSGILSEKRFQRISLKTKVELIQPAVRLKTIAQLPEKILRSASSLQYSINYRRKSLLKFALEICRISKVEFFEKNNFTPPLIDGGLDGFVDQM